MNIFESFGQENIETSPETGLDTIELVNYTEIANFEGCGLLTNKEVADYLRETLPPSHLENCPSIKYQSEYNQDCPDALGTFDRTNNEICIWGSPERFEGAGGMLETITHEVGHNVHENIMAQKPEIANKWSQLHEESWTTFTQDGMGFVSDYARTNVYEDFAETYMTYIWDSEKLLFFSPEKYEFMNNEIFAGIKYNTTDYCIPIDVKNLLEKIDESNDPNVLPSIDVYA